MHVVLVEPEIPQNTGSIGRTCAVTTTSLHLVGPLGFSLEDRYLRRAGLDYWEFLDVSCHNSLSELEAQYPRSRFFYTSAHASKWHTEVEYRDTDFLVFGKETEGLPTELLEAYPEQCITIPIAANARSMNLANAVSVVLFEAYRQLSFPYLQARSD